MPLLIETGWRRAKLCGFRGYESAEAQSFALRQPEEFKLGHHRTGKKFGDVWLPAV
jgi:hypothetical protein